MTSPKGKIKDLPETPGIYQFIGKSGEILYIGKAKNLQHRVKSYFVKEIGRGPAINLMVGAISDIRVIETESEIEAVILEADLIGKLKPKYNIRQKDDKSFLMIKMSQEDFPKVSLIRYKNVDWKDKSASYFGPYPAGDALKRSMRYLRRIFPYYDCSPAKYSKSKKSGRPCLYGDLGICDAPCVDRVTKDEYNKNINYLKNFLRGKKKDILKKLYEDMENFSKHQQFEAAAVIRDRINALLHIGAVAVGLKDDFTTAAKLAFRRIECYDIANISGQHSVGSMVVFTEGQADKEGYRKFRIKYQVTSTRYDAGDTWMINEVLERRFNNDWPVPDLLIIDGGLAHLNVALKVLKERKLDIPAISIAKGSKRDKNEFHFSNHAIAEYIKKNREIQIIAIKARNEAHRFAQSYYKKLHSKEMLQ